MMLMLMQVAVRLPMCGWSIAKALADPWILQFATVVAVLRIVVPLLREPLFFRIDSKVQTCTYSWVRFPWKKVLNIQQVHCRITEQLSHSGVRYYFQPFLDNKQLLNIEASARWPLTALKELCKYIASQK